MKILGIGNAIVDVICKVQDQYLIDNQLTKSAMKLVDEIEFQKLLSTLKIEETISGGSVANSIVGLSQLGNDVGFIGKVNDDDLGKKYEEGLTKEKVQYFYNKKQEISALTDPKSFKEVIEFGKQLGKLLIITRGEKGSVAKIGRASCRERV